MRFHPAAYQTIQGPVDSIGVYFRCRAEGRLLETGDETQAPRWVPVTQVTAWMEDDPARFDWISRAGLMFYRNQQELQTFWDYIEINPQKWESDQLHPSPPSNQFNQKTL